MWQGDVHPKPKRITNKNRFFAKRLKTQKKTIKEMFFKVTANSGLFQALYPQIIPVLLFVRTENNRV